MSVSFITGDSLSSCKSLICESILPELSEGNLRPLDENDFIEIRDKFQQISERLLDVLSSDSLDQSTQTDDTLREEFLYYFLIHCGQNSSESLWTSKNSYKACKRSFQLVFGDKESCLTILTAYDGKVLKNILNRLRPCLLTTTWKTYPTAVQCYVWLLHLLKRPDVGVYLDLMLPTALILTDDFTVENKKMGIKCLQHIINNVTLSELRVRSHEEVIYKTLESCLLDRDPSLVPGLIGCLLTLLAMMYRLSTDHYAKWSHYDDMMSKYLYKMKIEGDIKMRQALVESLSDVIASSGLITLRYMGNIIEIIEESIQSHLTVIPALNVILELMSVCSVYIQHHLKQLTFICIKVLYSMTSNSDSYKEVSHTDLNEVCKQVLVRIHSLQPQLLVELSQANQFVNLDSHIRDTVKQIIHSSTCT